MSGQPLPTGMIPELDIGQVIGMQYTTESANSQNRHRSEWVMDEVGIDYFLNQRVKSC